MWGKAARFDKPVSRCSPIRHRPGDAAAAGDVDRSTSAIGERDMAKTYVSGFEGTGGGYISTENWWLNATMRDQSFVSQCVDRAVAGAVTHYGLSPDGLDRRL